MYTQFLNEEFERRQSKNPSYSARAFARDLGLDVSGVLRVMRGEATPTLKSAVQMAAQLKLEAESAKRFVDSVAAELIADAVAGAKVRPACEHFVLKVEPA